MRSLLIGVVAMTFGIGASCSRADNPEIPKPARDIPLATSNHPRTAVLASGCFWCSEAVFENLPGVSDVVSGYSGGARGSANYHDVSSGSTDHAESIQITYDPSKITYGRLLQVFFSTHDPTTLDRQGPDEGTQYRSAIFYSSEEERKVAADYIQQLDAAHVFANPIVTRLEKFEAFYPAEAYHQDYARLNPLQPYIQRYAIPKAKKAKEKFGGDAPTTAPSR